MKTIYWNVDTQFDFMRNDESFSGKLAIPSAREIESNLEKLTKHAAQEDITVVNTADWHTWDSREISDTPDFKETFLPHCIMGSKGAQYIPATKPAKPYTIDWQDKEFYAERVNNTREIVLYKDEFDAFHPTGAPHTDKVIDIINPDRVILYGVATNVCVDFAVRGLLARGKEVYVVKDAIKELPGDIEPIYAAWEKLGAKFTTTEEVVKHATCDCYATVSSAR
ncbi:MAG: cysteine hydrolase family protein [Nanoarchaeota archaeon]